jgi:thymidylate synthase (FAD)
MNVTLKELTLNAEATMAYIARVSNPQNQDNPNYERLLRYCIEHQHWSVFEHAHMTLEIETSLAIATQILRHRTFTFQQFSQRYSDPTQLGFEPIEFRRQAEKNRQSSGDPLAEDEAVTADEIFQTAIRRCENAYSALIAVGVAREVARMVLPQCTQTRLYMTGNIRSWIHYLQLRTRQDTQLEHRAVALAAQAIFVAHLPVVAAALDWREG